MTDDITTPRSRLKETEKQAALALEGLGEEDAVAIESDACVHATTALASTRQALDALERDTLEVDS